MWARLNERGTHVVAKDERRKKKTDCRRATTTELTTMWRRWSSAPMCDAAAAAVVVVVLLGSLARLALTVASSVGRLVCRMNECSWCQPRPITRYTTLTQCLLLLLLASGCCRKRRRGAANDTALSFLCAFYSGPGRSSDRWSSSLLRLDY